jgi:hypothetical protein
VEERHAQPKLLPKPLPKLLLVLVALEEVVCQGWAPVASASGQEPAVVVEVVVVVQSSFQMPTILCLAAQEVLRTPKH